MGMEMERAERQKLYDELFKRLDALCAGETDPIALMATMACELKCSFRDFHWVGFYRNVGNETLKIGPYQGGHGCLAIPFSRGVCGRAAREMAVINVPDVSVLPYHIACSSTTRSEIAVPVRGADGALLAVLDIDSDLATAFGPTDEANLPRLEAYFKA